MILSASRRTDGPALYTDWFFKRLQDGYFLVPNPFVENGKIAKIDVKPVKAETNILGGKEVTGNIDGIVFWTKNPAPMLNRLNELNDYMHYFLYTLNPYGGNIERNLPPLDERLKTFRTLSEQIGAERVIWRYDPILLTHDFDVNRHIAQFESLATQLNGYTKRCKISFLIGKHAQMHAPDFSERRQIVAAISDIANKNGIKIETCTLAEEFTEFGVTKSSCIDPELWESLLQAKRKSKRLDNQRKECRCMPSVDVGIYHTCSNGCMYCYANGFYGYRGEPKALTDAARGEVYTRKIERDFNY
jgi:DNA repair photolyase